MDIELRGETDRPRPRLPERFLWAQAGLIAGWWVMLLVAPETRAWFVIAGWPEATLLAFLPPDAALPGLGSIVTAIGLRRGAPWARTSFAIVLGGVLYATLYCLAGTLGHGGGELGAALMTLCAALNAFFFCRLGR